MNRIHNAITQSHSNHPKLFQKSDELRKKLNQDNVQLLAANHVKSQNNLIVKQLLAVSKKAKDELFVLSEKEHALEDKVAEP